MTEEGERIAEAATGYKRCTVTGTRTQLAITLYAGMSLWAVDQGTAELYGWLSRLK